MSKHYQCLKKQTLYLQKQRLSLQITFTCSEVENLVRNNLKMMGCYVQMVDGLKQTQMCRSWLLSYLKFKDQKSEVFLPIKMATKEKQIGKRKSFICFHNLKRK